MALCSYAKEYTASSYTDIENVFVYDYMPEATGNAVKVYIYGLFCCQNSDFDITLETFAKSLKLTVEEVKDAFTYWEEFDLVSISSVEPFKVTYLPIRSHSASKPKRVKAEKYKGFADAVQSLIPTRIIGTNEFSEYFTIMDTYGILPEAMIMIIKYCVDLKGANIGHKYIATVAKNFGKEMILTPDLVDKKLSSYVSRTAEIEKILSAMGLKRSAEIDDLNLLNKWTKELGFEVDAIIYAGKKVKKGGFNKLDEFLLELYSAKKFSISEIEDYSKNKQNLFDLTIKFNKSLGLYVEVLDAEVENYISKWTSYGYNEESLLFIAKYCYKTSCKTLQRVDEVIEELYRLGLISIESLVSHFNYLKEIDGFITQILTASGSTRKPNNYDRDNLKIWRGWGFSDEMILEAAKLSAGKSSPIPYINAILGEWKNKGVFAPSQITEKSTIATYTKGNLHHFKNERKYTQEELDALIDDINDIKF